MPSPALLRILGILLLASISFLTGLEATAFADDQSPVTEGVKFYLEQVEPVLAKNCYKCHGEGKTKGGLTLFTRESLLMGGDSGPAVNLEQTEQSLMLEAINYGNYQMPPTGKLPAEQIEIITRWVKLGAPMPARQAVKVVEQHGPPQVNDETRQHWSFRKLQRPEVPTVQDTGWGVNSIDKFVQSQLEAAGLTPNAAADRRTLCRRLYYDLLGLPPTPDQVEEFAANPSPNAYRELVEQLLESPHYGEHWARYWLDLVRYAESNSFERDNPKPFVWRYRDYVIQAFNTDKPYDRFILEQLAGDEIPDGGHEGLIATGYYRLGPWDDEPADPELARFDELDDIVATTSQTFLGLTMNCARCHDHKLEPIPQADYYSMLAFFNNVRRYGQRSDQSVQQNSVRSIVSAEEEAALAGVKQAWEEEVRKLRTELDVFEDAFREKLVGGEKDDFQDDAVRAKIIRQYIGQHVTQSEFDDYFKLRKKWSQTSQNPPRSSVLALCVTENGAECPPTTIQIRGNAHVAGDEVPPAFPAILGGDTPEFSLPEGGQSCGRRLALARWIASPDNPLTARVMVNRLWQWHFGRGLVKSSSNLGLQGDAPTHPELIDWLATEFMAHGWSLKHMHRLILLSSTYRMSSAGQERALTQDPENNLLWRFDMRRLRAEEIRDSLLAVNGTLDLSRMYGPSIYPTIPEAVLAGQSRPGQNWNTSTPAEQRRRSIYIHIKRSLTVPLLAAFDVAEADFSCPVRFATTQPTQALGMLNSEFLNEQAQLLAEQLQRAAGTDPTAQVRWALQRVTQRPPTTTEIERGVRLMEALRTEYGQNNADALKNFCLVALNLNEFIYLD